MTCGGGRFSRSLTAVFPLPAACLLLQPPSVHAQSYPSRPIRIIVPASVSTPPDIVTRIAVNAINASEGWNMVVENRPGAGAGAGSARSAQAAPPMATRCLLSVFSADGFAKHLFPMSASISTPTLRRSLSLRSPAMCWWVNPSTPGPRRSGNWVEYLNANPDKGTFSSGGVGTPAPCYWRAIQAEKPGVRDDNMLPYTPNFPRAHLSDLLQGVNTYQFMAAAPGSRFHQVRSASRARGDAGKTDPRNCPTCRLWRKPVIPRADQLRLGRLVRKGRNTAGM